VTILQIIIGARVSTTLADNGQIWHRTVDQHAKFHMDRFIEVYLYRLGRQKIMKGDAKIRKLSVFGVARGHSSCLEMQRVK